MLNVSDLSIARGGKVLFEELGFSAGPGQRVGIVGPNGCGKTSLLKAIAGEIEPERGSIDLPAHWSLAVARQESPRGTDTAMDYVLAGAAELAELHAALRQAERQDDGEALARIHARMQALHAYSAEGRAGSLLHGLGFSADDQQRALDDFSGGWRARLSLARALFRRPDVLMLDEPTNHLDLPAIDWLAEWAVSYPGLLLCISHDRDFLDHVATHVLWMDRPAPRFYAGNLSTAETRRAQILETEARQRHKNLRQAAHLQQFVNRFRAKASKASQAQSRLKMLERLEISAPIAEYAGYRFEFPDPDRIASPLLTLDHADIGYGQESILRDVSLGILPGSRIGLLGRNGSGKSTLIKALAGKLEVDGRHEGRHLAIGHFAQHQLDQLRAAQSPLDHLRRLDSDAREQTLRDFLGGFGFHGDHALEPIAPRSGGEKARLALALLAWQRPNLLLLDEPTNHLDLQMRDALAVALQTFAGAVVLVSHDRAFMMSLCDEYYTTADARLHAAPEGPGAGTPVVADRQGEADAGGEDPRKVQRRRAAAERERLKPLRQQVQDLERKVESAQQELNEVQARLADPDLYDGEGKERKIQDLSRRSGQLKSELEMLETAWMEAQEALDAASNETEHR